RDRRSVRLADGHEDDAHSALAEHVLDPVRAELVADLKLPPLRSRRPAHRPSITLVRHFSYRGRGRILRRMNRRRLAIAYLLVFSISAVIALVAFLVGSDREPQPSVDGVYALSDASCVSAKERVSL